MSRVVSEILVEQRMSEYSDIFTTEQGAEIGNRAATFPKVQSITDNLLLNWRSVAYVAGMPPQFVLGPKATLESYAENPVNDTQLLMVTGAIINLITERIPELVDDLATRRKVHGALVEIGAKYRDSREKAKLEFPLDESWNEYLDVPAFHFYVWSSERLSFQAVYNAYEDFLVECVRVANSLAKCRPSGDTEGKSFSKWCSAGFGDEIRDECWSHSAVNRLRLVRHSLSHASGRITDDMRKQNTQVRTHNGTVQIFPGDVREAIKVLSARVLKVVDAANGMAQFQSAQ